jgi:hypothetical protein
MRWLHKEGLYVIAWAYTLAGRFLDAIDEPELAVRCYNISVDFACRSHHR